MPLTDSSSSRLERFEHEGVSPEARLSLKRMFEAWGYVAVLGGIAVACLLYEIWWPMYPAVGLLGILIWLRRI